MKQPFWFGLVAALLTGGVPDAPAQVPAAVVADRVNVRSRPSVSRGEVVTQLARGQKVIVFEEGLPSASPKEPVTEWTRIELPAGSPVWVAAEHVALPAGTVKVRRLNLRAGPSEDYAVLGTVAQGTALRSLEQRSDWLRIEAPLGLSGYVASALLRLEDKPAPVEAAPPMGTNMPPVPAVAADHATSAAEPPPGATVAPVAATIPKAIAPAPTASTPPVVHPLPASPGPAPAVAPSSPPPGETVPVPATYAGAPADSEPDAVEISPEPRIVRREGIVRATFSVQAPTPFELNAADNGKLLNYLLPRSTNVLIRPFRGQRVRITGEEYLEPRWVNAPIIVVHDIKLAP